MRDGQGRLNFRQERSQDDSGNEIQEKYKGQQQKRNRCCYGQRAVATVGHWREGRALPVNLSAFFRLQLRHRLWEVLQPVPGAQPVKSLVSVLRPETGKPWEFLMQAG